MVILHTNYGDIKLALNTETTPNTVENFLKYAKSGHYDNTIFHPFLIIKEYIIH
jgi:peptidyl-prolyl cis-trans isomerase B (cyclophilin B)